MVLIDQLRISDNAERLYINAHINEADYFDNIYFDEITIMTADKVSETTPELPTSNYIYHQVFDGNNKDIALVLTPTDFTKSWETDPAQMTFTHTDMMKTLFFVYIKCKGVPSVCTPCRLDEEVTLAVTFDENLLHQRVMDYTKQLVKDCQVNTGFIDFILLWNAFKSSVETEHFIPAIKYYNLLFGNQGDIVTNICGCNG